MSVSSFCGVFSMSGPDMNHLAGCCNLEFSHGQQTSLGAPMVVDRTIEPCFRSCNTCVLFMHFSIWPVILCRISKIATERVTINAHNSSVLRTTQMKTLTVRVPAVQRFALETRLISVHFWSRISIIRRCNKSEVDGALSKLD